MSERFRFSKEFPSKLQGKHGAVPRTGTQLIAHTADSRASLTGFHVCLGNTAVTCARCRVDDVYKLTRKTDSPFCTLRLIIIMMVKLGIAFVHTTPLRSDLASIQHLYHWYVAAGSVYHMSQDEDRPCIYLSITPPGGTRRTFANR